jgi:hypothetical protein
MLKNNKGSALVSVILLAIILNLVFAAVFMTVSKTQKKTGVKRIKTVVLSIAEAGKEHALSLFRSGSITPAVGTTTTILNNVAFGGGYYTVKCISSSADLMYLRSSAALGAAKCSIEVTCTVAGCPIPTDDAYNYGLVAGGFIDWTGSGSCNTGSARLHCNNEFRMSGSSNFFCQILSSSVRIKMNGSGDINGSIKSPQLSKSGSGKITGATSLVAVPNVAIPVIDLTPYYDHALKNGQVFLGKTINGSASVTVPGGVMWVNGDFKYSGSGDVYGTIIATGSVEISGSGMFTAASTYPAIVARDGNIKMSGSGKITGLIYARIGGVDKSGSGDVTGSIICGGDLDKSGSWNTLTYKYSAPMPPGCTEPKYVEVGWREL